MKTEKKDSRLYIRISKRQKNLLLRFLELESVRTNEKLTLSDFLVGSAMEKAKKTYKRNKAKYSKLYVQNNLFSDKL